MRYFIALRNERKYSLTKRASNYKHNIDKEPDDYNVRNPLKVSGNKHFYSSDTTRFKISQKIHLADFRSDGVRKKVKTHERRRASN